MVSIILYGINEDEWHLSLFGDSRERVNLYFGEAPREESDEEQLLGVALDKKANFKKHFQHYDKSRRKLRAHTHISVFRGHENLKFLMKTFFMS